MTDLNPITTIKNSTGLTDKLDIKMAKYSISVKFTEIDILLLLRKKNNIFSQNTHIEVFGNKGP